MVSPKPSSTSMISKRSVSSASWPRRTKQVRNWPRLVRFAPALLVGILVISWIFPLHAAPTRSLAEVAEYLRDGDYRLVRPSPSDSTKERQHSEACGADLERAYKVLTTEKKESKALVDAANVVSLCTTDNPKNRAKLTSTKGVPDALVTMIKSGDAASVAAAGECIWISSFNSVDNYNAFVKAGAIDALSNVLTSTATCEGESCFHAKMWCAAALQNLAAQYCESGHGYCDYQWEGEEADGDEVPYTVVIAETTKPKGDPTPVRKQLLENKALLEELEQGVCLHVDEMEVHPGERTWPSRANVPDDINNSDIVTWAYIGLAKNLAYEKGSFEKFSEHLVDCICDYAVQSPDWLEYGKAQDALWNAGLDYNEFCEPLYHEDECDDLEFVDDDGNGCEVYEEERWCAEFGSVENSDGVTPDDACCACGGGDDMAEEL